MDLAAFLATRNILLKAVVSAVVLGHSGTSYLAVLIGRDSDVLRIHVPVPTLAVSGACLTSTINSGTAIISIAIIAFVLVGGFAHFDPTNPGPSFFPSSAAGVFYAVVIRPGAAGL
ncbi:cationic amino acid transporter 8, vacuolar-like [Panicum virgatum]|uniref:cationic amino acid transporter 8, vacuolar-like n=1 Tax=Panicum virgatum TaxID=38727 RepID=UPI0019D566B6|nr:cationic amino acid transporter 8, vacuolar-like [Panicum virgatum]